MNSQMNNTNRQNVADIYPLSPMQQGMLFHSLYEPDADVYFVQFSCNLKGNVDTTIFEQAWQRLVEKYVVFRTAFIWEALSQPVQVVYRQVTVRVATFDWQHLTAQQQEQELAVFLESDQQKSLELSEAPLMRLNLIKLDKNTYQFVWSSHHLLLDGWSLSLVIKDFLKIYQEISQNQISTDQTVVSYRQYIAWLQQQEQKPAEEFWQQKLQGFTAPTPLVIERSANSKNSNVYKKQQIQFPASTTATCQSFVRKNRLTLNNLVQATWGLLLSRYSQETDIVFGATVSGRETSIAGIEAMVGLFINTLPMRIQLKPDTSALTLLKDLQAQLVESNQYSYSSLAEIQTWSEIPRGASLFDSIVVFENYPVDATAVLGNDSFCLENIQISQQTNYPLTLIALPGEQLQVRISYDTNRFDDGTITRLLGHFQTLLEGMVANPEARVSQLPLLTESEKNQLLIDGHNPQVDYPVTKCLHQLFEEQVKRTPEAVAVVYSDQQLTYNELNNRANQLAHYLQSLGVKPDQLVGICLERSLEMIVGLLGILKAGGAYLPLDPDYPSERLQFAIADAQLSLLLTQEGLIDKLPEHQARLILLDRFTEEINQNSQDNLTGVVTANNLANLIYTSGSTGKPKGVMVEHRGLFNLAQAQIKTFNLQSNYRILQFASLNFDASIWEIIMAIGAGATLYLDTKDALMPGLPLMGRLKDYGITHITLPPSALAALPLEDIPELQTIIVAGEACSEELIKQWATGRNFFNAYGPTETSVCATVEKWTDETLKVTIGRPIANTQIYILDSHLQPVPIGVPGELHIGGMGLARGYLNRPELTQEKFIPNPFEKDEVIPPTLLNKGGNEPSKLYKTGDLARYLPDGNIEYVGRIDNQVKIRGFRIELGEIEAVLSQNHAVQSSCVIVREDNPGEKQLVAYIVPKLGVKLTSGDLRQFLSHKLPGYMVPGAFVLLESFPLTANGKIDRRALKAPSNTSDSDRFIEARNQLELNLVQIWSKVLKIDKISVHDNFFDLGGHSLLAPYLITQIKEQLGKEIAVTTIFQNPTIEQLATIIQTDADSSNQSCLVPIQPQGSKPPFFCVPGAGGRPFYFYHLGRCLGKDQPFYSFENDLYQQFGEITRIEDIASIYLQAMQDLQPQGPYFLGGHSYGGNVAFEMAQQLVNQGQQVALLAIIDSSAPTYKDKQILLDYINWDHARWLAEVSKGIEVYLDKTIDISYETLQLLTVEEQLRYALNFFKLANMLPPNAETRQLEKIVQAYKTSCLCLIDYLPKQIYPGKITIIRAREELADDPNKDLIAGDCEDSSLGWSEFSTEPVEIHFVLGNHVSIMVEPHVQILAEELKVCLEI